MSFRETRAAVSRDKDASEAHLKADPDAPSRLGRHLFQEGGVITDLFIEQVRAPQREYVLRLFRPQGVAHPRIDQGIAGGFGLQRRGIVLSLHAPDLKIALPGPEVVIETTAKAQRSDPR